MKTALVLVVFLSTMVHAVDSSGATGNSASDLDYCKVPFKDSASGMSGTYRGQCVEGKPSGSGIVTLYNGDKLSGNFEDGVLSGEGTYTSADGNVYEGNWENGKRHGQGTFTWARGSSYQGEWIDDQRHGHGVFTWTNGNRFEGEFRNNKRYNGKYYTSSGKVYKCHMGQCK